MSKKRDNDEVTITNKQVNRVKTISVYNISVEDNQNYYVSFYGLLVHNYAFGPCNNYP